uniref:UDP-sugar transporter protein SLC35A4 n=1 Tax=Rhabditophanes sp. KR3021 TaxID=114890 RepID=A0AC35U6G3_9BILA
MAKFFFNFPLLINIIQFGLILIGMESLNAAGHFKISSYTFTKGMEMLFPSSLLSLSIYLTLGSLDGIALPMFPAIMKFAPVVVLAAIFFTSNRDTLSWKKLFNILMISTTGFLSGYYYLSYQPLSWIYGIMICILLPYTFYLFKQHCERTPTEDVIYTNVFNCFVIFLISDLVFDELDDFYLYCQSSISLLFVFSFIAQIVTGVMAHILLMILIKKLGVLSATITYTFLQTIQICFAYILSLAFFYDYSPTTFNFMMMALCTIYVWS